MADYEVLFKRGEYFRTYTSRPDLAIECYLAALDIGGPRDRQIKQMLGVSYRAEREYEVALWWLDQAGKGATDFEAGKILRDTAQVYTDWNKLETAAQCLEDALFLLPYSKYPEEYAITISFLGRLELRLGELGAALKHFAMADTILSYEANRHYELYNKLDYAGALSRADRHLWCMWVATRALLLSREYGSRKHRIRALALLFGGHNWEELLVKRKKA